MPHILYVDTLAPRIVSTSPTGKLVRPSANVVVAFDDYVYDSKQFVNIYDRGSNIPLVVYRYTYYDPDTNEAVGIEIAPESYPKRDTWYTVKVTTEVNDGANNLEALKIWNFNAK